MDETHTTTDATEPHSVSRREFVTTTAAAAAGFMIVPRHVLGHGFQAPSDRLNIATVGIGGLLIGLGGIALAFITMGAQLLFFSPAFVMMILTPLLLLMTIAFTIGFTRKG